MTELFRFGVQPITCHAWNKDKTKVAMSLNDNEVNIYSREGGGEFSLEDTLRGHDLRVTGVDWAPNTNRIVTCSADRNAYVWCLEGGKWVHTLVLLRINRAATCVRWSPQENKFAVGSGARLISVCYFEKENNWWVSKHIKKPIRSTISTIDWHPNNVLLVAGSSDFKVRVFSAWIKDIEPKPSATPWGNKMSLGQLMAEFSNSTGGGGWVHSVSFSSDGNKVCWVGHDSSVSVADASKEMAKTQNKTPFLPYTTVIWISDNSLLAAGHGCCPMIYGVEDSGKLSFVSKLDSQQKKDTSNLSAMRKFRSLDRTARSDSSDTTLSTLHQNTVTDVRVVKGDKAGTLVVSTTGSDANLILWNLQELPAAINDALHSHPLTTFMAREPGQEPRSFAPAVEEPLPLPGIDWEAFDLQWPSHDLGRVLDQE